MALQFFGSRAERNTGESTITANTTITAGFNNAVPVQNVWHSTFNSINHFDAKKVQQMFTFGNFGRMRAKKEHVKTSFSFVFRSFRGTNDAVFQPPTSRRLLGS
eukprot:EG_transcript_22926